MVARGITLIPPCGSINYFQLNSNVVTTSCTEQGSFLEAERMPETAGVFFLMTDQRSANQHTKMRFNVIIGKNRVPIEPSKKTTYFVLRKTPIIRGVSRESCVV